ncbi:MAG: peroxiredoxin [Candidatus Caldarchaeum sp.]|uniref:thioredoxin-dependent peroxiredoxin n=1 Tax=Caldiarchaeum subterraneum TaxID=311458 RepID=A0A7C4I706_CALS0
MLRVGDVAPGFELVSHTGERINLEKLRGRYVVLFFYPKDGSPGCTRENCLLRDNFEKFEKLGAVTLGISRDSVESHKRFAEKHGFTHHLLSDPSGEVVKAYGAAGLFGITKRITYVIDPEGCVAKIIQSINPSTHVSEALKTLETLSSSEASRTES